MARKTEKVLLTTKEEIERILPENRELLDDFLNYLETTDKSPASIKVYKNNLEIFFVYLLNNARNKDFVNIKKRDILNFQNHMVKNGLGSARIKNIRSSLSSLSNFIESILDEEEKWEDFRNIINKIPAPNPNPVREKTVLQDEDCQRLLDMLVKKHRYQEACAFALAWASGRRKSELLRIKKSWISDENLMYGSLYKTPEKIKTKGAGVKGKLLHVYILKPKFKKYYDLWMKERKRLGVPDDIEELFITKSKADEDGNITWRPITTSTLDYWAGKFSDFLGVDFYWHSMRHQFTTSLLSAKIPNSVIQSIIGWSSAEMILHYDDREIDDELGEYFSKDGIKQVEVGSLDKL